MIVLHNELRLELQNDGESVRFVFNPEIPFGATLRSAKLADRLINANIDQHAQDTHARVEFTLPHAKSVLTIGYAGGVTLLPTRRQITVGETSKSIKITGIKLDGPVYSIDFDYLPGEVSNIELRTDWKIENLKGAGCELISRSLYRCAIETSGHGKAFENGNATLTFARDSLRTKRALTP
jgi:hypothetical protein